jgi:polyferredoxin
MRTRLKNKRVWFQTGFFILFIVAPIFNIFRYDLNEGHFYLLGFSWTLGLEAFQQGLISPAQAALNLLLRGFLPLFVIAGAFILSAWRWGRLYCGWLCPHYSVVELINDLMFHACGKPSLWEKNPLPELQPDGRIIKPQKIYWPLTILGVLVFSFLWAVTLLTYLLPPNEIYYNLLHAELTRNQFTFIAVATFLLTIEFTFARHFFCRYGCAVGFFQSLAWMANRKAMVVSFDRSRASLCKQCNNACDNACPMRLKPRGNKRHMFNCTQCGECISACTLQQGNAPEQSLIIWNQGSAAEKQSQPPVGIPLKGQKG